VVKISMWWKKTWSVPGFSRFLVPVFYCFSEKYVVYKKSRYMQNFGKSQTCQMAGAENHGSRCYETAGLPKRVVRFFFIQVNSVWFCSVFLMV
jgi:hypothetical protein